MPEGYCGECKAKKEIADAVEEIVKNGRRAIKGRCPSCGEVMLKILGAEVVPRAPQVPSPLPSTEFQKPRESEDHSYPSI